MGLDCGHPAAGSRDKDCDFARKKPRTDRFVLPDDVAEYIARAIKSNVRELEGALTRLMAYASLTGAAISLATAQQVLRNIIASQEKRVTIDLIQKTRQRAFQFA